MFYRTTMSVCSFPTNDSLQRLLAHGEGQEYSKNLKINIVLNRRSKQGLIIILVCFHLYLKCYQSTNVLFFNQNSMSHFKCIVFYYDRGGKTQVEVGGLGPEECYLFRVGITRPNEQSPLLWSKTVPANTKGLWYWFFRICN